MSALAKQSFDDAILDSGDGDGKGRRMTMGAVFLLSDERQPQLNEYILGAIEESQRLLKLRMTTGQMHDPVVEFIVNTAKAGMVRIPITSAETLESSLKKLDHATRLQALKIQNGLCSVLGF